MQTATFDSQQLPAFGEAYARNRQQSSTNAVLSLATAIPGNIGERERAVLRLVDKIKSLWTGADSNPENASIFKDALQFAGAMPSDIALPSIWADRAEVVFEWIIGDQHAIVSCEGDGVIGYTYRVKGQFVPGQEAATRSDHFPADLAAYLA